MKKLDFSSQILTKTDRYSDSFALPDYLYDENGKFDRAATLSLLYAEEYGVLCEDGVSVSVTVEKEDATRCGGKCKNCMNLTFTMEKNGITSSFPVHLFLADTAAPTPLVVFINFPVEINRCYNPVEDAMERGISIAHVCYRDITSDNDDFTNGIAKLFGDRSDPHAPGKIAMWAYAVRQIGAYCVKQGYTTPDLLYTAGHSRLGKTALLAAAQDEIFAGACTNNSGCSGAAIARETRGETVERISHVFPFWFAPCYQTYSNRETEMPFDQHYLMACVAPRRVCVITAELDTWADTEAQYLCAEAASKVYEEAGCAGFVRGENLLKAGECSLNGEIGFVCLHGTHYMGKDNWNAFMDFIKTK